MQEPPNKQNGHARFKGQLRHYHRSGPPPKRTWEEWIDSKDTGTRKNTTKWLKVIGVLIALLALAAIIIGLAIELR